MLILSENLHAPFARGRPRAPGPGPRLGPPRLGLPQGSPLCRGLLSPPLFRHRPAPRCFLEHLIPTQIATPSSKLIVQRLFLERSGNRFILAACFWVLRPWTPDPTRGVDMSIWGCVVSGAGLEPTEQSTPKTSPATPHRRL